VRGDVQLADQALLGPERYSLGGLNSVRGYRTDLLVKDNGWFGSIEYRHLLGYLPVRAGPAETEGAVRLAVFVDGGQAWDKRNLPNALKTISGAGPGVRWDILPGLNFEFYYGYAFKNVTTPTQTLSDKGIYFRLAYSQPF
jgi:hemolysin activation/secretion protein